MSSSPASDGIYAWLEKYSLFFAFSLDRCDRLNLQPDRWRHELLDHEQRVRWQRLAFKELRVEFAAQAMEDRQIVLATQQGPQGDDALHLPARSLYGGLQVC